MSNCYLTDYHLYLLLVKEIYTKNPTASYFIFSPMSFAIMLILNIFVENQLSPFSNPIDTDLNPNISFSQKQQYQKQPPIFPHNLSTNTANCSQTHSQASNTHSDLLTSHVPMVPAVREGT